MRILVLNYEFPPLGGGAAPISKELAIRMAQKGHQVDVVTMGFRGLPDFENISGVRIYRIKCIRKKQSSCQPWEQLSYIIAAKKVIKKLIAENRYDLCHAHFIVPTGVLAKYVKRKYGLRYLVTAHGSDVEGHNSKKSNIIMHRLIRQLSGSIIREAEEVTAPSDFLLRLMKMRHEGNYLIIPNGIDLGKYRQKPGDGKEHRILYIGRLQKTKNVQTLIKAIARVDMGDWHVDIVGDGPYRNELERLTETLHLKETISFHGWITNGSDEHLSFLRRAALFVSNSYFESFGVAVIEAVAVGCSVLLSDIEAHRMLVNNPDCFTDPDDASTLSVKIGEFIQGEKDFSVDRKILDQYEWNNITDLYVKEYERIRI